MLNGKSDELVAMYHAGGPAAAPALAVPKVFFPEAPVDPMAGGDEAWSVYLGKGGGDPTAFGGRPMTAHIGTPPRLDPLRSNGRWALYDEIYDVARPRQQQV